MPPKKRKASIFEKRTDTIGGVQYTIYENGMLVVGTDSRRKTKTLKAGANVEAAARALAGLQDADHADHEHAAAAAEATASGTTTQSSSAAGLFGPVDAVMAEVNTVADRDRRAPNRLQATEMVRDKAASDGRRWRKRPAEAAPEEDALCQKPACVAARAERDSALARVEELQLAAEPWAELASGADEDARLQLAGRSFQVALLEILDGVDDSDEESDREENTVGSNDSTPGGAPR
jgi:hypothetical protein